MENERLKGAAAGAAVGAYLMLILGQVPPFTALPEEVLTAPAGALIGGIIGAAKPEYFK